METGSESAGCGYSVSDGSNERRCGNERTWTLSIVFDADPRWNFKTNFCTKHMDEWLTKMMPIIFKEVQANKPPPPSYMA